MGVESRPSHEGRELKPEIYRRDFVDSGRPSHEGRELKPRGLLVTNQQMVAPHTRGVN